MTETLRLAAIDLDQRWTLVLSVTPLPPTPLARRLDLAIKGRADTADTDHATFEATLHAVAREHAVSPALLETTFDIMLDQGALA